MDITGFKNIRFCILKISEYCYCFTGCKQCKAEQMCVVILIRRFFFFHFYYFQGVQRFFRTKCKDFSGFLGVESSF